MGAVKLARRPLERAIGCTLAEDVVVRQLPPSSIALRDGFAVEAAAVADASSYAPISLTAMPPRIDVGDTLPDGANAVLPLDAVMLRGNSAEIVAAPVAGEGVLITGGDAADGAVLRRAGERLRPVDFAILSAAGIPEAMFRTPRVCVACGGAADASAVQAALGFLAHSVTTAGADVLSSRKPISLDASLTGGHPDAVIVVGGTGGGRRDSAVKTLARHGRVEAHGLAISPGETAAFGFVGLRPILLVPGRLDAALALWLLVGRHLVARLAGGKVEERPAMLPLKRKVSSSIGLVEVVPVSCAAGMAEPLASGYLSLELLSRSDGWIVVPAESEGFAAGTPVVVRPWA